MCPIGYADDTQAIILAPAAAPMAEAQAVTDRTGVWMADTGQSGNVAKSMSWLLREPPVGVAPLTLGKVPIPLSWEFKQLGVGQHLAAEKGTGPVLRGRLDKGLAIMQRMGCLPTFSMREAALGTLANSVALYGVELADIEGRTLASTDTAAAKAIWGSTRCSQAKEVLWGLLAGGFYVSPLLRVQYQRMLWLARQAARRAPLRPSCRRCSSAGICRPPWGPWAGPCRPPANWAGSNEKGGGTGIC